MSRNTKIILGVVAGVVILCLCVAIAGAIVVNRFLRSAVSGVASDPATVANVGTTIADYIPPPGFEAQMSMKLLGMSIVGYSSDNDEQFIMLMQLPAGTNMEPAEMERQLATALRSNRYGSFGTNMHVVDETPVTIRGQQVTATTSEGTDDQGVTIRQLIAPFQGKGGLAMVMIIGRAASWNQAGIDAFLTSIR